MEWYFSILSIYLFTEVWEESKIYMYSFFGHAKKNFSECLKLN